MTWPDHLLTLEEWDALPEEEGRRVELVEGVLQVSPSPASPHQIASMLLGGQLNPQLMPAGWISCPEVDVVLEPSFPPVVRLPDLLIVSLDVARQRLKRFDAHQVRLVVEIVSPGSVRTDRIMKPADYAEAGIADYWILDLEGRPTLDAFRLHGRAYEPELRGAVGRVGLDAPVPLTLDLDALVP